MVRKSVIFLLTFIERYEELSNKIEKVRNVLRNMAYKSNKTRIILLINIVCYTNLNQVLYCGVVSYDMTFYEIYSYQTLRHINYKIIGNILFKYFES